MEFKVPISTRRSHSVPLLLLRLVKPKGRDKTLKRLVFTKALTTELNVKIHDRIAFSIGKENMFMVINVPKEIPHYITVGHEVNPVINNEDLITSIWEVLDINDECEFEVTFEKFYEGQKVYKLNLVKE